MPIITPTKGDLMRAQPIPDGWYGITVFYENTLPSKDNKSTNYWYKFIIDKTGHEVRQNFNSNEMGVAQLVALDEAIKGPMNGEPRPMDLENHSSKKIQGLIENQLYNGRMIPKFTQFASLESARSATPF